MTRPWSLRRRLALQMSLLAVAAVLIPLIFTVVQAHRQINTLTETVLQEQAAMVQKALVTENGSVAPMPPDLAQAYAQGSDGYLFVVRSKNGQTLASSSPLAERLLGGAARAPGKLFLVAPVSGGSWLAYTKAAGDLQVIVAQDQTQEDVLADSIAWDVAQAGLWLVLPLLLAILALVSLTLTFLFRQVDRVSAVAAALEPGEQTQPLPADGLPVEVVSLVQAANLALAKLSQAYATEKRFTADAAHELRTPLAVLTARVEALKSTKERAALQIDVARINRVVEQLLQAARLDARPVENTGTIDLGEALLQSVAEIAPLAVRKGRHITLDVAGEGPIRVRGDAGALAVVVANLVDNALRHTASGAVEITAAPSGEFSVLDRGPGVPHDEKRELFERFQRGRRPLGSGAGLGLAIVRQIVAQMGGTVSVTDRPGGGAAFTVKLKLARGPAA